MTDPQTTPPAPPQTFVHAVARWMIRPLVSTAITPNHLTTLRLLTGVAAALAFAVGDYFWVCWGGLLFVFSALLDRADGELARLSGRMSKAGGRYDLFSDSFSNVIAFIGIGVGLRESLLGAWAPWLGLLAGLAVGAIFIVVMKLEDNGVETGDAFHYPQGFDYDDALLLIGPIAWLDALLPLLLATVVGAPVFLVFAMWRYRVVTRQK